MRVDLSRLTRRRAAYASLATLLCGAAMLAGAMGIQEAGGARAESDCTEGPCFELRRVARCEGENCLEAVRAEGCETDQCFALKAVEACESDLCFQAFATAAPERPVRRSRGFGDPGVAPPAQAVKARPAPADTLTLRPRPSPLQALEQLEKCKRGNCFKVEQTTDCKAPPCFKAVRKDECSGPACFGVKKF